MITSRGESRWWKEGSNCISQDRILGIQAISIPNIIVFTNRNDAMDFSIFRSLNNPDFYQRVILTETNFDADKCNNYSKEAKPK